MKNEGSSQPGGGETKGDGKAGADQQKLSGLSGAATEGGTNPGSPSASSSQRSKIGRADVAASNLGGKGLSGGIGKGFAGGIKHSKNQLRAMKKSRRAGIAHGKTSTRPGGGGQLGINSRSGRRLGKMQGAMAGAANASAGGAAAAQTAAWENQPQAKSNLQSGEPETGEGGGSPGGGTSSGNSGGGSGAGFNFNEGTNSGTTLGSGNEPDGGTGSGNGSNNDPYSTPAVPEGTSMSPYQGLVDLAKTLMMVTSVLMILLALFSDSEFLKPYAMALYTVVFALSMFVAVLGAAIMAFGQFKQGALFILLGGLTAFFAGKALAAGAEAKAEEEAEREAALEEGKESMHAELEANSQLALGIDTPAGEMGNTNFAHPSAQDRVWQNMHGDTWLQDTATGEWVSVKPDVTVTEI